MLLTVLTGLSPIKWTINTFIKILTNIYNKIDLVDALNVEIISF